MESLQTAIDFLGGAAALWILAVIYFGSVIVERLWSIRGNPDYDNKDALNSIGLNLISSVLNLVIGILAPFALYVFAYENFRVFESIPLLVAVPVAFVAHEFAY